MGGSKSISALFFQGYSTTGDRAYSFTHSEVSFQIILPRYPILLNNRNQNRQINQNRLKLRTMVLRVCSKNHLRLITNIKRARALE